VGQCAHSTGKPLKMEALEKENTGHSNRSGNEESGDIHRRLWGNLPVAIVVLEGEKVVYANKKAHTLLRAEPEYLEKKKNNHSVFDYIPASLKEAFFESYKKAVLAGEEGLSEEWDIRDVSGEKRRVQAISSKVVFENRDCVQVVFSDITEKHQDRELAAEAREKFLKITRNIEEVIYIIALENGSGKVEFVSENIYKLIGLTPKQYLARFQRILERVHPEDLPRVLEASAQSRNTKKPYTRTYRYLHHQTENYVWLEERVYPEYDNEGNPKAILGVTRDISGRMETEKTISESETKFRMLATNARDVIYKFVFLPEPRYDYISPSIFDLSGYAPEEFYRDPLLGYKIIHPADVAKLEKSRSKIERKEGFRNPIQSPLILRWVKKNGEIIWTETRNKPVYDEHGTVVAMEGISRDITAYKEKEFRLSESEEKFKILGSNAPVGIMLCSPDGKIFYSNKKFREIFEVDGNSEDQINWQSKIAPAHRERVLSHLAQSLKTGEDCREEFRIEQSGINNQRWVRISGQAIFEGGNRGSAISGWVGIAEDVTGHKEAEERIIQSEKRYRELFENNVSGVFRSTPSGKILDCNQSYRNMFGYSLEELKNLTAEIFYYSPEERKKYVEELREKGKVKNLQLRLKKKDGTEIFVLVSAYLRKEEGFPGGIIEGTVIENTAIIKAQEALQKSEKTLSTLMGNLPGMAYRCLMDSNWTMLFVSKGCEELTGYRPEELLQNQKVTFSSLVMPEDRHVGGLQIKQAIRDKTPFEIEYRIVDRGGRVKWVWERGEGVYNEEGDLMYLEGFVTDITERKGFEIIQEETRKAYKNLIESAPEGLFVHNKQGTILFVNQKAMAIMGARQQTEIVGKNVLSFSVPEDIDKIKDLRGIMESGGETPYIESRVVRLDGTVIHVETKPIPFDFYGSPSILVFFRDLTYQRQLEKEQLRAQIAEETNVRLQDEIQERKKTERRLREAQKYTRLLIDSSLDMICASDKDGTLTEFNLAAQKTFGYSQEEVLGKPVAILYANPKEREKISTEHLLKTGAFSGEVTNLKKNGETFRSYLSASVLKNDRGEVIGAMGVSRDISELKRNEEKLRQSEERYRAIYNQAFTGIALVSFEGVFLQVNQKLCEMMGYSENELLGRNFLEITHPEDKKAGIKEREKLMLGKKENYQVEKRYLHKSGKIIYTNLLVSLVRDTENKPQYTVAVYEDITQRKEAEAKIIKQAAQLQSIIESSSHQILTIDTEFRLTSFNRRQAEWIKAHYGIDPFVGLPMTSEIMLLDESHNNIWIERLNEALKGKSQHFEIPFRMNDGMDFWREVYMNPIFDINKNVVEISVISHDITEKKAAEENLKQSLKEKEILLKEVHHRVKNNLQVISSILNLQSTYVKDKNNLNMLRESQDRIKSMAFIHESLYQTKDFSNVNFSEYVLNLSNNLMHSYDLSGRSVKIDRQVDPIQLNLDQSIPCGLIINELVSNALKYAFPVKKNGIITLKVKEKGGKITIIVADNGVGMPPDMDFRNTESLGLQLVVTLVEQLGGEITLEKKRGTNFKFSFLRTPKNAK
jgi:PAS domain S-box-containing protein